MADYFLWALIALSVYSGLRRFKQHNFSDWPHFEKRRVNVRASGVAVFYIVVVWILMSMIVNGDLSRVNLGIKQGISPYFCFTVGFAINLLFQIVYRNYLHKVHILNSTIENYRAFRTLLPKNRIEKYILMITVILFNPIYEETIFRGFLVHNLSIKIDNIFIPIVAGYIVFIVLHLYQGASVIFQHTINYVIFIVFLFSPLGLIGAIGFHYGGDLFPFLWIKDVINDYRLKFRESRAFRLSKMV